MYTYSVPGTKSCIHIFCTLLGFLLFVIASIFYWETYFVYMQYDIKIIKSCTFLLQRALNIHWCLSSSLTCSKLRTAIQQELQEDNVWGFFLWNQIITALNEMNLIASKFGDRENSIAAQVALWFPQIILLPASYVDQSEKGKGLDICDFLLNRHEFIVKSK